MYISYHKSLILLLISSMILVAYVSELIADDTKKINNNQPKIIHNLYDVDKITINPEKQKRKVKLVSEIVKESNENDFIKVNQINSKKEIEFNSPTNNNYKDYDNDSLLFNNKKSLVNKPKSINNHTSF